MIPVIEANAKFVVTPENIAVNVTSPVTLKCAVDTNNTVRWFKMTGSKRSTVFNGYNIASNLSMVYSIGRGPTDGSYKLIINSTGMLEAGRYECMEPFSRINRSSELIVLGKLLFYLSNLKDVIMESFMIDHQINF